MYRGVWGHSLVSFTALLLSWFWMAFNGIFVICSPDFIHPWVYLALKALTGSLFSVSLTREIEAMCSLVRGQRYKPFALKRPWLGKIRSCDSLAGCKLFELFGLFNFLVSVSLFHLPRSFSSFLLSGLNTSVTEYLLCGRCVQEWGV